MRYVSTRGKVPALGFDDVLLEGLARDGQLMAYKHDSFWQCMDTLREKHILETIWQGGDAPWKSW